jgi:peptidoglycan L-alanyl-D-glutamate endopeptidase CwlK
MTEIIIGFLSANPHFAVLLTVVSFCRAVFKPTCALIQLYVDSTPTIKDNEAWKSLQENKIFKSLAFIMDYFLSIKLPK